MIARVQTSRIALRSRWRSSSKYFSIQEETVEELGGAKGPGKAEVSRVKTDFSRPGKGVE